MIQALQRGLEILRLVADDGVRTPTQVAQTLEIHASSALRLMQTLEECGFLRRDPSGYRLGPSLARYGSQLLAELDVREVAQPHLRRLGELTEETVHLALLTGHEILYVEKVESVHSVRMYSRVGATVPPHCTGVGKAILSGNDEYLAWLQKRDYELTKFTSTTITSFSALTDELERIRARGWAIDNEEHEASIICLASAFTNASGIAVGALSIAAPTYRISLADLEGYSPALLTATTAISRQLGASV